MVERERVCWKGEETENGREGDSGLEGRKDNGRRG
jgi:hypothetical protein